MNDDGMKIAFLGTRGVPARYGGFETAAEEVGARLVGRGHEVIVYCRNPKQTLVAYRGMRLVNLPALRARVLETLSHTGLSVGHAIIRARPAVAIVFNPANAPYLPLLRLAGIPTAVHLDGLDWKRAKWAGLGSRYYRTAERLSVRLAGGVIADSRAIGDYVEQTYGRSSTYIAYGAPIIRRATDRLAEVGLSPWSYHLLVARLEPENNIAMMIEGHRRSRTRQPLVVVGSAPYADEYVARIRDAAHEGVRFFGAVWDQELLDQLYANCLSYLHGHSVGGTNPSLLRAMGAGAPATVYDVTFNREVTAELARFFRDAEGVAAAIELDESDRATATARGVAGQGRVATLYDWDEVAAGYEQLCIRLANQ
jgi:glycosyltransferase involved in cell wall biosynthesis